MLQQPTAPIHQPSQTPISMERHIQQTNERLQVICQQLKTPQGFMSAARELLEWCSDIRAFQPQYEMGLMVCLQAVSRFAASPGFDLNLGYRLLAVCSSHKERFSPDHAGVLGQWCGELGKLMLLRHQNRARTSLDMNRTPSQSAAMDIARAAALYAANQQMQQRPYVGENSQWMPSDQFSVVTTVHAGGMNPPPPTTPTDSNMPAQYMTSMNPNISYTTSPHTHGSSQWAPPNANLFQQPSGLLPPNHVAVPQGTPASYPSQPSQMYGQMSGGPSAAGQPAPARSQGSNLTAAAAAAAAVVAAATATAHATATLTLKPGDAPMQPHGYDNVHPPSLHPPPSHSLPAQSQPVPSGPQQAAPLSVGSQLHGTPSIVTTTSAPISVTTTPSSSSSSSTPSSSSLMTPIQAPPATTTPNNILPNSQVQPPNLPQHPVQQLATSQTTPPSQPHPANSATASSVSSHPPPNTPLSSSSPGLHSTPVSSHAAAPPLPHSTDTPPPTSVSSSSSSSSSASLTTGPMATRSATPQFCSPPGDQGSQVTIQPNPAAGVRRTNSPATPGHQNAMMPQQHYPGHQPPPMQSQRSIPPQYQQFYPQMQSWAPQGSAMSPGHRVQYVASPPPAGSPMAPQQVYARPHTYPQQGAGMPNSLQPGVQPGVPTNAGVPGHYPMPYGNQRPRNLPLEGHEMAGSPVDPYGSPVSTPQAPGYRRPPRYPYHPQSSPAPSPHAPFMKMYARTPTGYPVHSPVQPGPPTPTMQPVGPPPYGAGPPGTPTDSGYYGSMQNMHQPTGAVPSPLSRGHVQYMSPDPTPHGVPSFPMQSPPPPGYPNSQYTVMGGSPANPGPRPRAPAGVHPVSMQNDRLLRLTFPIREGVMLRPFQLEHGKVISHQSFHLKESVYRMLLHRNDLELQFKCYHSNDRQMLCQWPQGVSVSLDGRPLPIDRGDSKTSQKPLYLKHYCQLDTNTLEITATSCCCSHYFVLQLVHRPSVTSVLSGLLRKRLLPTEHCIAKIKRWFASNSDDSVQQTGVRVSLKCPVTFKRISLPARGAECKHIQCFDLEAYLKMNCERGTWRCPVCSSNAQLEGLEVDHYIWGIISEVNHRNLDVDEVMVDATAEWKPMEKPPDLKDEEVDTPPPKKPKVESVMSPANSASDSHPAPAATVPCYNGNGISNPHKDLNTTPSAPLSTPSVSSSLAPNSQVPSRIQNSNHIAPQVSNSSASISSGSRSSSSSVVNQHASHFNTGGHLATAVTNSTGQQPPAHGQQHNNDNLFDGLEDTDDLNLLHYLNDELPSHELLSSILDP